MSQFLSQSWLLDRRHALRALGSCISLPFLECMVPLRAAEQQTATPRRSAFIYLANGVHSLNYQITTPGKDYQFSRSLKPLEKHREVITPISGLHHPGALSHHHNCISVWLTGGKLGPSDKNTISVDQKMAEITAKHTRYPSMEIALTGDSLGWTADGVRLPSMRRCSEIFASLFEEPKGGKTFQRRTLRRKGSVLDANLAEVRRLEQAMGAGDKGRLDQYLTSVREAEVRTRRPIDAIFAHDGASGSRQPVDRDTAPSAVQKRERHRTCWPHASSNGAITVQGCPLLPAEHANRGDCRHHDLHRKRGDRNPYGRVVFAEILPKVRHSRALAPATAMGPVERRKEHGEDFEQPALDRQDRCSEQDLGRDQERHREHPLVG